MSIEQEAVEFVGKRELYCRQQCKFKLEAIEDEITEDTENNIQTRRHLKMLMYCESCGFVDDIETALPNESPAS